MNSGPAEGDPPAASRASGGGWQRVGAFVRVPGRTGESAAPPAPDTPPPPPAPARGGDGATPVYDRLVAEYRARNLTVPRAPEDGPQPEDVP